MFPGKATKAHIGSRITAVLNLNLGATWSCVVNIHSGRFAPRKDPHALWKGVIVDTVRNINTNIAFLLYFCLYYALLGSLLANKLIPIFGKGRKIEAHVNKKLMFNFYVADKKVRHKQNNKIR